MNDKAYKMNLLKRMVDVQCLRIEKLNAEIPRDTPNENLREIAKILKEINEFYDSHCGGE